MRFENAPFKLSREMMLVMGNRDSEQFRWFTDLVLRAYLVLRCRISTLLC